MEPQEIWANGICLMGIWSSEPVRLVRDEEKGYWVGEDPHFRIDHLGPDTQKSEYNCIEHVFSSEDKQQVELWTNGAMSVLNVMRQFGSVKRGH